MLKVIFAVAALGLCTAAFAGSTATSKTESVANSAAQNMGNAQAITFNSDASGTQRIENVPSMGGAGFYGSFSPDACTVSAGGSLAFAGIGGSAVSPVTDDACVLYRGFERSMQASATFQALSEVTTAARLRQAAIDMLCQVSDAMKAALAHQGLCSDLKAERLRVAQSTDKWGFTSRVEP